MYGPAKLLDVNKLYSKSRICVQLCQTKSKSVQVDEELYLPKTDAFSRARVLEWIPRTDRHRVLKGSSLAEFDLKQNAEKYALK